MAAGVAEHSAYRTDPFGRLQRTLAAMSAITFGTIPAALAAARGVERAHAHVAGTLPETVGRYRAGTPYSGRDPEAVRWVWATLADTAWCIYERFVEPLDAEACEAYYADHRVLARLLGVPAEIVPEDWPGFRAYFDGMLEGDALAVSAQARDIARHVLAAPDPVTGAKARTITAGLLPEAYRTAFELPWDAAEAARFEELIASVRRLRAG